MKRRILAMLLVMAVSVFMLVPEGEVYFIKADTETEGQAVTNGAVTQPEQIASEEDLQNVAAPVILGDETKHEMKFTKQPVEKNEKEASYLVVTKNTEGKKKLLNQYKERKASKHSGYAKEEGILTLEMNGTEASELQKRSDVLYIEKDISVSACTDKKAEKEKIKQNRRFIEKKKEKQGKSWNQQMVKTKEKQEKLKKRVKVAVLDSGIDYGNDMEYEDQINLIKGEEEVSPLFVDDSGHGTSVAGIIAAQDNGKGITGINPEVELYSAKILDANDSAPISRVVDGIYWAMEKGVHIINISFSTPEESQVLEKAIKDAYNQGILIIAAAGNEGKVEYPAAYPEVMAIGSVDCQGVVSDKSAKGEELELVAPGEKITSTSLLGGTLVSSGTSLAAPHAVGVASLLWQKDLSVPADMIRELLKCSANGYGEADKYGFGLVDYTYADSIYEQFKKDYLSHQLTEEKVSTVYENNADVVVFEEDNTVEGRWADHAGTAESYGAVATFQRGAKDPDVLPGLKGLNDNHAWHGGRFCNYIAIYRYLNKVARAVGKLDATASLAEIQATIAGVPAVEGMDYYYLSYLVYRTAGYEIGVYARMKQDLLINVAGTLCGAKGRTKEAYVFGLASHVATDFYAHSSFHYTGSNWKYLYHRTKTEIVNGAPVILLDKEHPLYADKAKCVERRLASAKAVLVKVIDRYNNKRKEINIIRDFQIAKVATDPRERLYYNTRKIKFTEAEQNDDATYRLFAFGDYMREAGEKSLDLLQMYDEMTTKIITNYK